MLSVHSRKGGKGGASVVGREGETDRVGDLYLFESRGVVGLREDLGSDMS